MAPFELFAGLLAGGGARKRILARLGYPRLHTDAVGVHGVWVNGQRVADAGGMREDAPGAGMLLR